MKAHSIDGVLLEPEASIDDTQLDANSDDEYLGQLTEDEARTIEYKNQQMPCALCIHCGCIDNGGAQCARCKICKCMKAGENDRS